MINHLIKHLVALFEWILNIPFIDVLWMAAVALKLTGFTTLSWWIVLIPLYVPLIIFFIVFFVDSKRLSIFD